METENLIEEEVEIENLSIYPYLEYLIEPPRLQDQIKDDGHQLSYRIVNPHLNMYYDDYIEEKEVVNLKNKGFDDEEICKSEILKRFDYINSNYSRHQINRILDGTFDSCDVNVATNKTFVEKIFSNNTIIITEDFINTDKPCCGICQSPFQISEKAIKLPCKNSENKSTPHYFHIGDNPESCLGIKPWLDINNTCPVCRYSLPSQQEQNQKEKESEVDQNDDDLSMDQDDVIDCITIFSNLYSNGRCRSDPPERCLDPRCIEQREQMEIDKVNQEMIDKALQVSIEHSILNTENKCLMEDQEKIFANIDLNASEEALLELALSNSLENM